MKETRTAYYEVTIELMHELVSALVASKVPADARILRVDMDPLTQSFRFRIEHPSFEPIDEGCLPPCLDYATTSKYRVALDCAAATMRLTT